MSTSISISELPVIGLPILPTDNVIVSRGPSQDYRTTMQAIWTISSTAFPTAPQIQASDLIMIWSGGAPYMTAFNNVGFIQGTTIWFYSASAPSGWQVVSVAGDAMLGIMSNATGDVFSTGGTTQNNTGSAASGQFTWKMTATQLPAHAHPINNTASTGSKKVNVVNAQNNVTSFGTFETLLSSSTDWGTWRPVTAIGVLAAKL